MNAWMIVLCLASGADAGPAPDAMSDATSDAMSDAVPVTAPDAGIATAVDAGAAPSTGARVLGDAGGLSPLIGEPPAQVPARVHEQASPLVFRVPLGAKDARTRAREASAAMESALSTGPSDAPLVDIEARGGRAVVRVKGRAVATLTLDDAQADGALELGPYADELETRLTAFVAAEDRRKGAQQVALHVFLSVAIALLALLTMRALLTMFGRLERSLEQRKETPTPLKLFGVVLLSGEALRGVTVILLVVGRVLSLVAVSMAALLFSLSQFDRTRPWVGTVASWAVSPVVTGADALVRALPGVVLAAALAVVGAAAIRLARLLLDDIGAGRVPSRLGPGRVRPMRALAAATVVLVFAPLVIAAAFSRFGTPLETLALFAGAAVALAGVPMVASAVVGGAVLWRARVSIGDWVTIGQVEGEVSSVDLLDITLVPSSGGTVVVPMVALAFAPLQRHAKGPGIELRVVVKRDRALTDIESALVRVVRAVDGAATVEWVSLSADAADAVLRVSSLRAEARSALVRAVAEASERSEITLLGR